MKVVAIFDIGKTNKKFFLFDETYTIVHQETKEFAEIQDEDGFGCDDISAISKWVLDTWQNINQNSKFDIKALNFSAYGASLMYLDENLEVLGPLYNYLKPNPENISEKFYQTYGTKNQIALETASPILGSLNSGMQIYRLKMEQPQVFDKVKYCLHLPQFLSFLITKQPFTEFTSIGCHTQMWDFRKKTYHDWLINSKIIDKLVPLVRSNHTINVKGVEVGLGLHDSSSALIAYLSNRLNDFVLISTGTWAISINPSNQQALTEDELNNDCLCFLDQEGKAIKISRLFSGYYHQQQCQRLAEYFNSESNFYENISYDCPQFSTKSIEQKFEDINLNKFSNISEAYHVLIEDIVHQQGQSTDLVLKNAAVTKIYVDGGFSKNEIFMHLLAKKYPEHEIFAAEIAQASALGAALIIHSTWNSNEVPSNLISFKKYSN